MTRNLHAEITARIVAKLREGVAPWRQPWSVKGTGAMPRKAVAYLRQLALAEPQEIAARVAPIAAPARQSLQLRLF
jgi:hypothetical protein